MLRELGALDGDGRITAEGNSLRALALPPRLARMIVDSHRLGAGEEAAEIAAVLTERGLGGDSVDLEHRLDQFRRDRSQRGEQRAQSGAAMGGAGGRRRRIASPARGAASHRTGVMLALAFPDRVARNRGNGSFVLANGRGAAVDQTSSLARAPYIAVGELTGTAAQGKILLAAPIAQADIEAHFAGRDRDRRRDIVRSQRDGVAGAAQAHGCMRSRCRKRRWRWSHRRRPRGCWPMA